MSLAELKTSAVSPESPWLGLRPFTEDVCQYFFGRDAEVRDLFQRVVNKPLTVLFGRSGLGKTSLLQAALVPRLRDAGFLPIVLGLDYADGTPPLLRQFVDALIAALIPALPGLDVSLTRLPLDARLPWLLFHDPVLSLTSPEAPRPVVLLDQFEEIFTMGQATSERQAATAEFLEMLADLVENRLPESLRSRLETDDALADRLDYAARPAKILLSLRADFLHLLERHRGRMPALMDNRFELRPLSGPKALEAVIEPGRLRCRPGTDLAPLVTEATGGAIVRFVVGVAPDIPLEEIDAVPPLLSLLCAELNEQRLAAGENVIRPEQLEGRAEDILGQFYERCFSSQPTAVRRFVEDRLLSADGFRESTTLDTATHELVRAGLTRAAAVEAIARLVDARLLTSEERGGVQRIELTHDILTSVARPSRDARVEQEAAARRRRQRTRFIAIIFGLALLVAGVSVPLAVWALRERVHAVNLLKEAQKSNAVAEAAARRAIQARDEAEKLIAFMQSDLHNKLEQVGRLSLLEDVNKQVQAYLDSFAGEEESPDILRRRRVLFNNQGDVLRAGGNLGAALTSYYNGLAIAQKLAGQDPTNTLLQGDIAVSYKAIGDVLRSQGNLPWALKSYQDSFAIVQKLSSQVPGNAAWQHDLAMSYEKIGDVLRDQGNLPGVLESVRNSLVIRQKLANQEPGNAAWQLNLVFSCERLGDVLRVQGDLNGALESYRDCLAIRKKLANQDPGNAGWQLAPAFSYERIGDVLRDQGDLKGAIESYSDSLATRKKLANQDPGNAGWQSDLAASYERIGDVLRDQDDLKGALESHRDSFDIRQTLANQDPGNASWQRDLAASYERIGDVLRVQGELGNALKNYRGTAIRVYVWFPFFGDLANALKNYGDSFKIRQTLANQDPGNTEWWRDLAFSYERIGDVLCDQGDLANALKNYRDSFKIRQTLANQDPGNADWQHNLAASYERIGDVLHDQGDLKGALESHRADLAIAEKLASQNPNNAIWQCDLAIAYLCVGEVWSRVEADSKLKAGGMIEKGGDILRGLRERVVLTALQQSRLDAIEERLSPKPNTKNL
jgi:tetratricopeptide (TPR) repeat protein